MDIAELKKTIQQKAKEGTFSAADIPEYLTLFCAIGNATPSVQQQAAGWNCRLQVSLGSAGEHWIQVTEGVFSSGSGPLEAPDVTLTMEPSVAAGIFSGQKDPRMAFFTGGLKIGGSLPQAMKFQGIVGTIAKELEVGPR